MDYFRTNDIFASLTSENSTICVYRISGKQLLKKLLLKGVLNKKQSDSLKSNGRTVGRLGNPAVDQGLMLFFESPKSFTGEDVFEFHGHGGKINHLRLFQFFQNLGFAHALPGEFSFRAVKNSKITVKQASAIQEMVTAHSSLNFETGLENVLSESGLFWKEIKSELVRNLALTEVSIDFSDEHGVGEYRDLVLKNLSSVQEKLKKVISTSLSIQKSKKCFSVCILGEPNAGKSRLFNALVRQDLAIVSDIPGTTRDTLRERVILKDPDSKAFKEVLFLDTAGLREASDEIEKIGIERSKSNAALADLLILAVDSKDFLKTQALPLLKMIESLRLEEKQLMLVFTKKDLLSFSEIEFIQKEPIHLSKIKISPVLVSSIKNEGMEEILREVFKKDPQPYEAVFESYQIESIENALRELDILGEVLDFELLAVHIRSCLDHLSVVFGETSNDDVLNQIFSSFCIGK